MPSNMKHVLLLSPAAFGHQRQLLGFGCKLLQRCGGSIVLTLPTAGDYALLSEKEVDRYLPSETDKHMKKNVHIINLGGEGRAAIDLVPVLFGAILPFYNSLESLTPIKCATGRIHTFSQPPDIIIADESWFMAETIKAIHQTSRRKIPVICWNAAAIGPVMRIIGPKALGGLGDIEAEAKLLAARTNKSSEEAELEIFHPATGEVIRTPGMPPLHDYEYYPHEFDPKIVVMQIPFHKGAYWMMNECEAMVSASNTAFEPEGCRATNAWFAEIGRRMYTVGPVMPDDVLHETPFDPRNAATLELDEAEKGPEILAFLNRIYTTHGAHSVLFISFGTLFWPKGEGIWSIIEYVLDENIPLLFGYDEPKIGGIPVHIAKKFEASDTAFTAHWISQQTVLAHPAIAWFMTHCGHNGTEEAMIQGVPMIAWPMDAEQPGTAAYISVLLNIAYEVVGGRSGLGLRPMYRGIIPIGTTEALKEEFKDILKKAFGEDGKQKGENIRALRDKIRACIRPGGDSYADIDRFIRDFLK